MLDLRSELGFGGEREKDVMELWGLVMGMAVQCGNRMFFVRRIMGLPAADQEAIKAVIQPLLDLRPVD